MPPIDIEELKSAMEEDGEVKTFIQSMVSTSVDEATSSLKKTNKELKDEKTKVQKILDKMPSSEELEGFKKLQTVLDSSEDAKLIADGKIDEVIDRRTERAKAEYESKLKTVADELEETKGKLNNVNSSYDNHRINEAIRAEALKESVAVEALPDVVLRASGLFSIDESGDIVATDSEGHPVLNEAGTPIDVKVFIADLKSKAPHFWPGSKGAGLGGQGGTQTDTLVAAAEKGNTQGYIEGRRKQRKEQREAR